MKFYPPIIICFLLSCQPASNEKNKTKPVASVTPVSKVLPDSLLTGELIDGPANIRDTVNGKLCFTLYNNVPVATTVAVNKWLQVGVIADITPRQFNARTLEKGDKILFQGVELGTVLNKIGLSEINETRQGYKAELTGYTSTKNINAASIPEDAVAAIVNTNANPTLDKFRAFLKSGGFWKSDSKYFTGFQLDENWIDDPSPMLRLWVLFDDNKLFAIVNSRSLDIKNAEHFKLARGFALTVPGTQDQKKVNDFVSEFNDYITHVD